MTKLAKKPKNRKGVYQRNDKKYEEDYNTDIPYGYLAKGLNTPKKNKQMKGPNNVA